MSIRVKRWRVVYSRPGYQRSIGFERRSVLMRKIEARHMLRIFNDAIYIEKVSGIWQRRIMKKGNP